MYTITCTDLKQVNSVSFNIKVNSVSFNGKDFPTNIPAKSSGWGGWVWDQAPPPPHLACMRFAGYEYMRIPYKE